METMNKSDLSRNAYMLRGPLARRGYDWWWHSFTGCSRKTGAERAFFIEYFAVNPALAGDVPSFGQKGDGVLPSYVMVKAGAWGKDARQLHRFFAFKDVSIAHRGLNVSAGDCALSETAMCGSVSVSDADAKAHPEWMSDAGSMSWNLQIRKKIAFNVGFGASPFFRFLNCFEMFWHAEGIKTEYSGSVTFEGEEYDIIPERSYGYADKNWGGDFTSPWVWIASANLTSLVSGKRLENSAIDIGGGRPKAFGLALPRRLLMAFFYEGTDYEFNFSKFWTRTKTTFDCGETDTEIFWNVRTRNRSAEMEVRCVCPKAEMLNVNYEAPDGKKRHNRLWNGGTGTGEISLWRRTGFAGRGRELVDRVAMRNVGCEYGEYCTPEESAAKGR
jgi:hypothetical protein